MKAKSIFQALFVLLALAALPSCLKTRGEVSEARYSGASQDRMSQLQKDVADRNAEIDHLNSELRNMYGRIESLESARAANQQSAAMGSDQMQATLQRTGEDLRLLEQEVTRLSQAVSALQSQVASGGGGGGGSSAEELGNFGGAERDFDRKNWRDAILGYEKYREMNPRGRRFSESTYKIGYSFEQLGMKPEARAFYQEVVAKDKKSSWATKANQRLKKL